MSGRILNFGSLNLDYVYRVAHFVKPGETISAESQSVIPGGKGLNQSCALARAGAQVFHAGCVGIGGGRLAELLQDNGVNTSFLVKVSQLQGNAVIQVDSTGENCILLFGGSNQCITERQIDDTLSEFGSGDFLLLQNEINNLPLIAEKAFAQGMTVVLNPSPYNDKLKAVDFGSLSWLMVNEVEMEQITGSDNPETAWEMLHREYPMLSLLITLGKQGSMAFQMRNGSVRTARQSAFPAKALDTTAAGDTYTGYFLAGLMEGKPLEDCMRLAAMASAISVTRAGAAPSIPKRPEVEAMLNCEESRTPENGI